MPWRRRSPRLPAWGGSEPRDGLGESRMNAPGCGVGLAALAAGIDRLGGEDLATPGQQGFLHQTAGFETARLVVMAFRGRAAAMAEQLRGDADMGWVVDRDAGGGAIAKQMQVDRVA